MIYNIKLNEVIFLFWAFVWECKFDSTGSEGTEQVGLDFIPGRVKILEKKPNKLPHLVGIQ